MDTKHIDTVFDLEDPQKSASELMKTINSDWKEEDIMLKEIDAGYINRMFRCSLVTDAAFDDAVVIRVFGDSFDHVASRVREIQGLRLADAAGCGTPLITTFQNGVVMGYFKGRNITYLDYFNPKIMKCVQRTMARFHSIDYDALDFVDNKGEPTTLKDRNHFIDMIKDQWKAIPAQPTDPDKCKRFEEDFTSKETIYLEIDFLQDFFRDLNFDECICHNDLHQRNIMYEDETDRMVLVDFELCNVGFEVYDTTLPFFSKELYEYIKFCSPEDPDATDADLLLWTRWYMEGKSEFLGLTFTEDDVQKYYLQFQIMMIVSLFCRCTLVLSLIDDKTLSAFGLDMSLIARMFWRKYSSNKSRLLELKTEYIKMYGTPIANKY